MSLFFLRKDKILNATDKKMCNPYQNSDEVFLRLTEVSMRILLQASSRLDTKTL